MPDVSPPLELTTAIDRTLCRLPNIGAKRAVLLAGVFASIKLPEPNAEAFLVHAKDKLGKQKKLNAWRALWSPEQLPLSVFGKRLGVDIDEDGDDIVLAAGGAGGGAGAGAGAGPATAST